MYNSFDNMIIGRGTNKENANSDFYNDYSKATNGKNIVVKIKSFENNDNNEMIANIELLSIGNDASAVESFKKSGYTFSISREHLYLDHEEFIKEATKEIGNIEISELFKPENNVIVKSFKSTGGRGLAGVITDLSFDYYENVTWETSTAGGFNNGIGNQAPKLCKVSLSFSPIHDIAPGIDYNGFNRAPVYPIGHPYPRDTEGESE